VCTYKPDSDLFCWCPLLKCFCRDVLGCRGGVPALAAPAHVMVVGLPVGGVLKRGAERAFVCGLCGLPETAAWSC
jgi:hypothetical protein